MFCYNPDIKTYWDDKLFKWQDYLQPCGKCPACRINSKREWVVRMAHELKDWSHNAFVTLTYDDSALPANGSLDKQEIRKFLKRLRERLDRLCNGRRFKYYLVGEYGEKRLRPHYHAILFGVDPSDIEHIRHCWPYGFVRADPVDPGAIKYVVGYVQKKQMKEDGREWLSYHERNVAPVFSLVSSKPTIGATYFNERRTHIILKRGYTLAFGCKTGLPRLFRRKFENVDERNLKNEQLDENTTAFLERLNKIASEYGSENVWRRYFDEVEQRYKNWEAKQRLRKPRDVE